jgi:hypothetical protein
MSTSLMQQITSIIRKILGNFKFTHKIYMDKKESILTLGIKIGHFSTGIKIRIKKNVSNIVFVLNDLKYKLVMINNSFTMAIKAACAFVKGIMTDDAKVISKIHKLSLSKKDFKRLKADKKEFLSKLKKQKKENRGPLVVKLGRRMPEIPLY